MVEPHTFNDDCWCGHELTEHYIAAWAVREEDRTVECFTCQEDRITGRDREVD